MLSGWQPSQGQTSSALYQCQNNVKTVAPSEGTTGSRSISNLSASQYMVDALGCGLPPSHASSTSATQSYGQQSPMSKGHQHKGLNSRDDKHHQRQLPKTPSVAVNNTHSIISQKSKVPDGNHLIQLMNKKESSQFLQQSKRTRLLSSETLVTSSSPMVSRSSDEPYLNDDQILNLIDAQLNTFRVILKARQETSSGEDPLNVIKPKHGFFPQATTSHASGPSEDNTLNGSRQDAEQLEHNGTTSTKAKESTDYVRITQEATAICTKREEENPVVLNARSGPTLDGILKKNPSPVLHYNPPHQIYKSMLLNGNQSPDIDKDSDLGTLKNTVNELVPVPDVVMFSKCTKSVPSLPALKISDRHIVKAKEHSCQGQQNSTAGSENLKAHVLDVKLSVANYSQGPKQALDCQEFLEELTMQTKEGQIGEGKIEKLLSDSKSKYFSLKDPQYDDISEEELNVMRQVSTHNMYSQYEDISDDDPPLHRVSKHLTKAQLIEPLDVESNMTQFPTIDTSTPYEDISEDERLIRNVATAKLSEQVLTMDSNANGKTELAATDSLEKQGVKLSCSCPYLIETETGFEESLCQNCLQDDGLACGGSQSKTAFDNQHESESDDWFIVVLTASDIRLEQEIIVLDDTESGGEENQDVACPLKYDQNNLSCVQKIEEYDTLESFVQSKQKQYDISLNGSIVPLETTDKVPSKSESAPCFEVEDSCDTEDSCDYPLQTECNHLTVSRQVNLQSTLLHQSRSQEDGKVPQPSQSTKSGSFESRTGYKDRREYFPDSSSDEEEPSSDNATNHVTVDSTPKAMPGKKPQGEKSIELAKKPRFKKQRIIYSDSDSDDNNDDNNGPNCNKTRKRSYSSGPGDPSMQQNEQSLNTGCSMVDKRPDRNLQLVSSVCKLKNVSVSGKVRSQSQPVHQNQAMRKPIPSTASTSDQSKDKSKRKRPSPDASGRLTQMPYRTDSLTAAKKEVEYAWQRSYFPTKSDKKSSNNKNANTETAPIKTATKKNLEVAKKPLPGSTLARKRHNSQESQAPLMKKSKDDARRYKQAINCQEPSKQNHINSITSGYKWSEKRKMSRPSTGCGSDKFSGHPQRPHH